MATYTVADNVWFTWTTDSASSTAVSGAWENWTIQTASSTSCTANAWFYWCDEAPVLSDEERAAVAARQAEQARQAAERRTVWERQRAKEAEERQAAEAKAEALLLEHLTPEQRDSYTRKKEFEVQTESGRRYRLRHGWAGNVDELDENGRAVNRLCIHPAVHVPNPDNLLAQKLLLQWDEERFRKIANHTRLQALAREAPAARA